MPPTLSGPLRFLGQAVVLAALLAMLIGYAQSPTTGLYGYDGYFHIRYAELGFQKTFPWWQQTFLAREYADKDLLFHVLLGPLAHGDLEEAGKRASVIFAVALYMSLFLAIRWTKCHGAFLWTLALAASSTTLLYRSGLLRSHVLAISLALLGTAAILRGRRFAIAILSGGYALTHIAWHLLPGIAIIHDILRSLRERRPRYAATLSSLAGTVIAILLNPYFPHNLRLWYVQNVQVLLMSWTAPVQDLGLGLEILPGPISQLISYNPGPALFTLAGLALLIAARGRDAAWPGAATAGLVSLGFLGMTLMSRRFVEFWAPMSVLFVALTWTRYVRPRQPLRPAWLTAGILLAVLAGAAGWHTLSQTRRIIGEDPGRIYTACAGWIRDNVEPGQTVFTTDWDEFPELFFTAPQQHYLAGLDPTFVYVTSPERWRLWREIVEGQVADPRGAIEREFGSSIVFADAGFEIFEERADQDPGFRLEVRSPDCSVYSLGPEVPPVGAWDPWRANGGPALAVPPGGFVDIYRLLDGPAPASRCATVTGGVLLSGESRGRLSIVTDDTIEVSIDGRRIHDSRDVAPPTLDEALQQRRAGTHSLERTLEAALHPGYNAVTVSTCCKKNVWGFHMWTEIEP